jgi:hypothetical protein
MLQPMQSPSQAMPSPSSQGFAGLFASLASPRSGVASSTPELSFDDFGDDVVTLSYERALRNHSRYKPSDAADWTLPKTTNRESGDAPEAPSPTADLGDESTLADTTATLKSAGDRDLRSTSVTIRLSSAESARLHQRASEAGVTVSAYLRSCTFEADALRAQVKAALAELRMAPARKQVVTSAPVRHSWFGWMVRLFKRMSPAVRVAQV